MKCLLLIALTVTAAASLPGRALGATTPIRRIRGRSPAASAVHERSLDGAPFFYTVVVDLHEMSASGFECDVQGYSLAPFSTWNGMNCSLGCEGECGLITFHFEPAETSGAVAQYFVEGLQARNYFPYAPLTDDLNFPTQMYFSTILNVTIPHSNGTTEYGLSGLRIGYGDSGTLDWWVGSASCTNHGYRETLYCNENLVLGSTCDSHYYADDALNSGFDACIQLSTGP